MNQDVYANSTESGLGESSYAGAGAETADDTETPVLYAKPIERAHIVFPVPDGWIRWMSWGDIHAGDCRMSGALLHLYPDANVHFQAHTSSSSSGDVWLMKGLQFYDQFHHPVGYPIPQHNGMNMAWEGSEYPLIFWAAIPGVSPSGAAQITTATMTNHC